ncbi:unnamed protein product [Bursaphelenchus okinawaensis]|uniref:Uncharacterized protein n=1 Tax=Bursaphelenchus okinawaensis TaxID=465554 RepID=A0A811LRR6_9BILA|nr:unnamed protein product [Bursaphelenchus okinawaensis]CAG9127829.1 unnamed protein product [Bursaphelenchus okinawaensis]
MIRQLEKRCTFKYHQEPCYLGSYYSTATRKIEHKMNMFVKSKTLCKYNTNVNDAADNVCCREPDCLQMCYPDWSSASNIVEF